MIEELLGDRTRPAAELTVLRARIPKILSASTTPNKPSNE
jgi:hypothetical protein